MTVVTTDIPWHGIGTTVAGLMTAEEAIEKAGLDWDVELRKAYFEGADGGAIEIPGRFATVRTDLELPLGIVSGEYQTLPNREAFAFTTPLATIGAAYDSAGDWGDGKRIFLTMLLEKTVLDEDPHDVYLFLQTSHNGSKAVEATVTPVRRRCTNQDSLILKTAKNRWSIRHTTTMHERLAEAQDTLKRTYSYLESFEEIARRLLEIEVGLEEFGAMLEKTLSPAVRRPKQIASILQVRETSPLLDDIRPTAWGALQAFTEWTDHHREYRQPRAKVKAAVDGWVAQNRSHLANLLLSR